MSVEPQQWQTCSRHGFVPACFAHGRKRTCNRPAARRLATALLGATICFGAVIGCDRKSGDGDAAKPAPDTASPAPGAAPPVSGHATTATRDNLLAKLAKADAYDGKTDKIVSRCAGCGLGMDGSDRFVVEIEGYKLHLCNEACRKQFADDTVNAVLAMRVPESRP